MERRNGDNMKSKKPIVVERKRGDWLWVENGVGWRLDPASHQWVPLEDQHHVGGIVLSDAQVGSLIQMFGRPLAN
jgi:hypothetical protein